MANSQVGQMIAIAAIVAQFNGGATVFQQAWAAAKEDEAVGRWAMLLGQPRTATRLTLQLVALLFPGGQALGRFFAPEREQARPVQEKIFSR
jgi:hypothetical protein